MIIKRNAGILEKHTMYPLTLCSFWKNISGPMINLYWVRFPCNHSYGYALITGFLLFTLRARFAHVKSFLRFYRRIVQTDSLTDFIKHVPHCLHSYEISGLKPDFLNTSLRGEYHILPHDVLTPPLKQDVIQEHA